MLTITYFMLSFIEPYLGLCIPFRRENMYVSFGENSAERRAEQSPGVLTMWLEGEPAHRCKEPFMPCPGPQGGRGSVSRPDSRL